MGARVRPPSGEGRKEPASASASDATKRSSSLSVAIVHDYLTQMGGAERLVLTMCKAFPEAPVYTSVYEPLRTFPEFRQIDVRPMPWLNSLSMLRKNHRIGLPIYGPAFRRLTVEADLTLCSSSGWAHLVNTSGTKVVYCYTPARWLYQSATYTSQLSPAVRVGMRLLAPALCRADRVGARTADLYITSSTAVQRRIYDVYGRKSRVIAPPPAVSVEGPRQPLKMEPGYLLTVSRLLPYKNVELVIAAAARAGRRLVVVGAGPDRARLERVAGAHCQFLGSVSDSVLRWLYENCAAVVAMSYEDYGLVPVEANSFGRPVVALRWGGFLDTVVDEKTGIFCEELTIESLVAALSRCAHHGWDTAVLQDHAERFSEAAFVSALRSTLLQDLLANKALAEPSGVR